MAITSHADESMTLTVVVACGQRAFGITTVDVVVVSKGKNRRTR